jgi:hypothetical protein
MNASAAGRTAGGSHAISRRRFLSLLGPGAVVWPALAATDAPMEGQRRFRENREVFANPERGFYAQRRSDRMDRLEGLRAQGISLLLVTFDLRDCRARDVPAEKLAELSRALDVSRESGYKVVFRAAYGFTNQDYRVDPHDLGRILGHIGQIGAVLTANRDVLGGIQAGMLGPWGEWHGSNHGNLPSLESRRAVLFGWLEAVPAPITVHVRRPMFIRDIFASQPGGYELDASAAFSGSRLSRTGWHNDAFLVRPSDYGTYAERGWDRERELAWCSRHGRFTPFGGETIHTDTPMAMEETIREMELLHATYLNSGYHPRVLQLWRDTVHGGGNAFQHIARRLGYRFVGERLAYAQAIRRGGSCPFELTLRNVGFASPHLPRIVEAGLVSSGAAQPPHAVALPHADPRRWGPEEGTVRVRGSVPVPAAFPRGRCGLAIRLADPAERLREDSRFAIRLANEDVAFSAVGGWNLLADDISCAS